MPGSHYGKGGGYMGRTTTKKRAKQTASRAASPQGRGRTTRTGTSRASGGTRNPPTRRR